MRVPMIRHQLFLPGALSERLEALARAPGASKSAILADAVQAWLDRRASGELEDRFGRRLDRLTSTLGRVERNSHVILETLSLFIRYELATYVPLSESDHAGRALAIKRFNEFVEIVGRMVAAEKRTIAAAVEEL